MLGETIHITTELLTQEEKAVVAGSKVEVQEVESFKMRKGLIAAMGEGNSAKERVKTLIEELKV